MMNFCQKIALLLLLGYGLSQPVSADIYVFAADDGALSLSNVQEDGRYTLLVASPREASNETSANNKTKKGTTMKSGYDRIVNETSRVYGLESALLHAVISVESNYNPKAVSQKGAAGLMQLMPATAKRYGVADTFDPEQNIGGGAQYLHDLMQLFGNDLSLAIAAYNAGETAVMKHGNRIPPYRETRNYVSRVLDFYQRYRSSF